MYGEVQPRGVDNVIGLILIGSLYINCLYLIHNVTPKQLSEMIEKKLEKLTLDLEDAMKERIIEKMVFEDCKGISDIINCYPVNGDDAEVLLRAYIEILSKYNLHGDMLKTFLRDTVNEKQFDDWRMSRKRSY